MILMFWQIWNSCPPLHTKKEKKLNLKSNWIAKSDCLSWMCKLALGDYFFIQVSLTLTAIDDRKKTDTINNFICYFNVYRISLKIFYQHQIMKLVDQQVILSTGHFVNRSFCQQVILSTGHFVNRSFCQQVILSTSHFVNRSFY